MKILGIAWLLGKTVGVAWLKASEEYFGEVSAVENRGPTRSHINKGIDPTELLKEYEDDTRNKRPPIPVDRNELGKAVTMLLDPVFAI